VDVFFSVVFFDDENAILKRGTNFSLLKSDDSSFLQAETEIFVTVGFGAQNQFRACDVPSGDLRLHTVNNLISFLLASFSPKFRFEYQVRRRSSCFRVPLSL